MKNGGRACLTTNFSPHVAVVWLYFVTFAAVLQSILPPTPWHNHHSESRKAATTHIAHGKCNHILRHAERVALGLAHDHPAPRHPCFSHHPPAVSTTQVAHRHPPVGSARLVAAGRRVAVWRIGHGACRHHRHGQHYRCGHGGGAGRSGRGVLVLADGRVWHLHEIR